MSLLISYHTKDLCCGVVPPHDTIATQVPLESRPLDHLLITARQSLMALVAAKPFLKDMWEGQIPLENEDHRKTCCVVVFFRHAGSLNLFGDESRVPDTFNFQLHSVKAKRGKFPRVFLTPNSSFHRELVIHSPEKSEFYEGEPLLLLNTKYLDNQSRAATQLHQNKQKGPKQESSESEASLVDQMKGKSHVDF